MVFFDRLIEELKIILLNVQLKIKVKNKVEKIAEVILNTKTQLMSFMLVNLLDLLLICYYVTLKRMSK